MNQVSKTIRTHAVLRSGALARTSFAAIAVTAALCAGGVASASAEELVLTNAAGGNVNEQPMGYESTDLKVTTSGTGTTVRASASHKRAHAASTLNIYLLTHPWVIRDIPAWEHSVGPAQNVFENPFSAGLTSPGGGATLESYESGGQMIPWLGTIDVSGRGTLKAITPNMRFVLAFPNGGMCTFETKQMKLSYPVGTPGAPVPLKPAFKQAFSLDPAHSLGGPCPAKATLTGSFDIFTEDPAGQQQVFIQS
jgi:hypothetical protein